MGARSGGGLTTMTSPPMRSALPFPTASTICAPTSARCLPRFAQHARLRRSLHRQVVGTGRRRPVSEFPSSSDPGRFRWQQRPPLPSLVAQHSLAEIAPPPIELQSIGRAFHRDNASRHFLQPVAFDPGVREGSTCHSQRQLLAVYLKIHIVILAPD